MEHCSYCSCSMENGGTPFQYCGHLFCWNCLNSIINEATSHKINCSLEACHGYIEHTEIRWLVSNEVYENYISRVGEIPEVNVNSDSGSSDSSGSDDFDTDEDIRRFYEEYSTKLQNTTEAGQSEDTSSVVQNSDSDESSTEASGYSEATNVDATDVSGWSQLALMMKRLQIRKGLSDEEVQRETDKKSVYVTIKQITCGICLTEAEAGDGIIIKDCLHMFCRECLTQHIEHAESVEIPCPHTQDGYNCDSNLKPREVKQLCTRSGVYKKHYEELSIKAVENAKDMVHCLTPNCHYFCEAQEGVDGFQCPVCKQETCLVCKVRHTGLTCIQYKKKLKEEEDAQKRAKQIAEDEKNRVLQRQNDILSQQEIQRRLANRHIKPCPRCKNNIEKNGGCDHMNCRSCGHRFNWSTAANYT